MKKKEKLSTEEKEMVDEIESYMKEVDSQPDVAESPLPPELQAKIHQQIETRALARETAERERMSQEERELIRLGKISGRDGRQESMWYWRLHWLRCWRWG